MPMLPENIKALATLNARFGMMARVASLAVGPGLQKTADELVEKMKDLAPKESGALADSIVATPAGEQTPENAYGESHIVPKHHVAITAGNREVPYAVEVEFGTSKTEAEPFFYPAYNSMHLDQLKANLQSVVVGAIVKNAIKAALS